MALTIQQLKQAAKTEDLKSVQFIKLEGLELSDCFHLLLSEVGVSIFILSLRNNILDTIGIPLGFTNLRKLDLSTNLLTSIGSVKLWSTMPRLQVLYLHDNLLETWETFTSLSSLDRILHLTLFNNPCIHLPQYRKFMLSSLPSLLALDFHIATQEERLGIAMPDPEKSKIWIQDCSDLRSLKQHLYKLRRKFEKCSPSIKIQSVWRSFYVRRHMGGHLSERDQQAILIQKHVRGWLLRLKLRRDLEKLLKETNNEYLLFTPQEYVHFKAVRTIENFYSRYKVKRDYKRKIFKAATKISSMFRGWQQSRYDLPILRSRKIYVLKSQQRTLICMLRALAMYNKDLYHPANSIFDRMAPEFFEVQEKKSKGYSFPELFNRISECKSIKMVRFPDIENLPYTWVPLLQVMKWVGMAKILNSGHGKGLAGLSIPKKYCQPEELAKLKKFRIRGSIITHEERKKFKGLDLKLDEYFDLVEFECPTLEFLQELFLMVLAYNRCVIKKDLPIFLPLFNELVNRVKSACTIQACYRGYLVRKKNLIASMAIRRRAVFCIQRWWRSLRFLHRIKYLIKLKVLLKTYSSPIVYIQEHLFQYLRPSSSTFTFIDQNFNFFCSGDTIFINQVTRKTFLPSWVGCSCKIDHGGGFSVSEEEKTLQAVVLSGAKVEIIKLQSEIEDVPRVSDSHMRFIKLEYRSVDEVKRRASVLYLKTLDYRTGSFVPLFNKEDLSHEFLMSHLRKIWTTRNINPLDPCPALDILSKALNPPEIIIKAQPVLMHNSGDSPTAPSKVILSQSQPAEPIQSVSPVIKSEIQMEVHSDHSEFGQEKNNESEILKQRVKFAREDMQRRHAELKIAKQMELEMKMDIFKEAREHTNEILTFRKKIEEKELELKRSFIQAQIRKKQEVNNEKLFVMQFSQAKNMIGKLMKSSELERVKVREKQDVKEKVESFKEKCKERRELVQAILYEKYKTIKRNTL
jgi:hypothetical protein